MVPAMPYTIMTGPGQGVFDSSHDTDAHAIKMGRELMRQGRQNVQIIDADGRAFSVEGFEHMIAKGGGTVA